ncbi:hypothetical protein BJX70DRAFT_364381 [Aspergillus crustosus]
MHGYRCHIRSMQSIFPSCIYRHVGNWFISQAPGSGYTQIPNPTNIEAEAPTITSSSSSWEASWARYWTNLPSSNSSSPEARKPGSGLSRGAKLGISVGCTVGAMLIIFLLYGYSSFVRAVGPLGSSSPVKVKNKLR